MCNAEYISKNEIFKVIKLNGDTVSFFTMDDKVLSHQAKNNNMIMTRQANMDMDVRFIMQFIDDDDNRVILKNYSGDHIIIDIEPYFVLKVADQNAKPEIFRIYHVYTIN